MSEVTAWDGEVNTLSGTILIVDDDLAVSRVLSAMLKQAGMEVFSAHSGRSALEQLQREPVDVLLTDLKMPDLDGLGLLKSVRSEWPDIPVIMLTAHATIATAVLAMKLGALDFLTKPSDREEVLSAVRKALWVARRQRPVDSLDESDVTEGLGNAPAMQQLRRTIARVARTQATVLIRGESGSGKEVAALAIHRKSQRADKPMVVVNCAALPENLLESELFGHERGAFTGAINAKPGRVELAEGSTLFLDEVGELPLPLQPKLLRLLQAQEYTRVGGTATKKADIRFIAATHRALESMVKEGTFREDLYYRLNAIPLDVPPLRARLSDVALLAGYQLTTLCKRHHRARPQLSQSALDALIAYPWPGNVRELHNCMERLAVLVEEEVITAQHIAEHLRPMISTEPNVALATPAGAEGVPIAHEVRLAEKSAILRALQQSGDNRTLAARLLGISRRSLYNKLRDLDIA